MVRFAVNWKAFKMKHLNPILILFVLLNGAVFAQPVPPLTVVVVIDQLPITLITDNMNIFSEDGFRRLDREGVFYTECRYRHGVLETGPGHATIATGCDPKTHGIVGNGWRNPDGSSEYCVQCEGVHPLGSTGGVAVLGTSNCPENILVDGLSDAWRKKFGDDAKIWSMSHKDRAAIAMGGKKPDGVLWANSNEGGFESSTYYGVSIPEWCRVYNEGIAQYQNRTWDRLGISENYTRCDPDSSDYERGGNVGLSNTLPKVMPSFDPLKLKEYGAALKSSPFGNEWLFGLAKTCIAEEKLGQDEVPDLLWISFSSNDICGHVFGSLSHETLDMTLRTDGIIAELLTHLDKTVGKENYLFALSADHGVCPPFESPQIAEGVGGRFSFKQMKAELNQVLQSNVDVEAHSSGEFVVELGIPDVSFDRVAIQQAHLELRETATRAVNWLREQPGVADVMLTLTIEDVQTIADSTLRSHVSNNFYPGRSGDAYLHPKMYWQSDGSTSNHGSCHDYDLHVPMFLMGAPFGQGRSQVLCAPEDLAPTLGEALGLDWEVPREGWSLKAP